MANKKQAAPAPVVTTSMSKEQRTQARKDAHRAANEAARKRNIELRAAGQPTPHEVKKAQRAAARKPKQVEFERKRDAMEQARLRREAERTRQQESLATQLIEEHRSKTGTAAAKKIVRKPSPVTVTQRGA